MWVGTYGGGLARLQDGRFTTYTAKEGLGANFVLALYEDADGTLWIGTFGGGLSRLKDGRFASFTTREGLPDDVVFQILEDNEGRLWMSCDRGVFRVDKAELEAVAAGKATSVRSVLYDKADGMKSSQCNSGSQPAGCRSRDGTLWFPTTKGVVRIDPRKLIMNPRVPPVVVEEVFVDKKRVVPGTEARLPPGRGELELHYAALNFLIPERMRFRYRLEGFDHAWVEAGNRRTAYYTNIPPGPYRFRVIASNDEGVWNEEGAALNLRLAPHFHQTRWFYALCALGAVLAGAALYHLRVRGLKAREKELASRVDAALAKIQVLDGLLPICAWCKKIRDDKGYWNQLEAYIGDRSRAEFTHGICPECTAQMSPGKAAKPSDPVA